MSKLSTSPQRIYALLVGIDNYPAPVFPLNGCVNDINALENYLKEWADPTGERLYLKKLTNQDATRKNIIDGFRDHLSNAGENDVVLFAYSGHGSQEKADPAFWRLEPDRLNETLVCYDSRIPGNWDLADKELNQLIAEVGKRCPHIVAILDCCHSGSGLRETATIRRTVTDRRDRPLDSYIFSPDALSQFTNQSSEASPSGWQISGAKYILLAACRDTETAKEYPIDGQPRGAFSYFLLDTLKQANGNLSYRDLFKRASALVESKVKMQSPQLESLDQTALNQRFLGGDIAPHPFYFTLKKDKTRGWIIDGGAIHRIPLPEGQETTVLAIFPFNSSFEQLIDSANAVAHARVTQVFPDSSQVEFVAEEPDGEVFKAVVIYLPLPRLGVYVEGDAEGAAFIRQALQRPAPQQASLYVCLVEQSSEAKLRVLCNDGKYLITDANNNRPLTAVVQNYMPENAKQVVTHLEHITRWLNVIELSCPAISQIPPNAIRMQLYDQTGQEILSSRFEYQQNQQGEWIETPFKLKLTNTSSQTLYCTVLNLSEQYGIDTLFEAGGVWLQPGQEAWALGGNLLYPQIPKEWWQRDGITETQDVFKLVVSTTAFDARLLVQDALDPFHPNKDVSHQGSQSETVRGSLQGMLNNLMNRIQWRKVNTRPEHALISDWTTSQIVITTVRPQPAKLLPIIKDDDRSPKTIGRSDLITSDSDRSPKTVGRDDLSGVTSLGFGVKIYAHPQFQAQARLITVSQAVDLGNCLFPSHWRDEPDAVEVFRFTAGRGSDPGLSILELSSVSASAARTVTPETPLRIAIDRNLEDNEHLIPIAFNGQTFLTLGRSIQTAEGETEVFLEQLPISLNQQQHSMERSTKGEIRILCLVVIDQT